MKQRSRPKKIFDYIKKATWLWVILSVFISIGLPLILWQFTSIKNYIEGKLGLALWHVIAIMTGGVFFVLDTCSIQTKPSTARNKSNTNKNKSSTTRNKSRTATDKQHTISS